MGDFPFFSLRGRGIFLGFNSYESFNLAFVNHCQPCPLWCVILDKAKNRTGIVQVMQYGDFETLNHTGL